MRKRENIKKFGIRAAIIFGVLLFLEICIFNLKSYTKDKEEFILELSTAQTESAENVEIREDGVVFRGDGNIMFLTESENLEAIQLRFSGEDQRFICTVSIEDENFSESFQEVAQKYTSCAYGKFETSFLPYGTLKGIKISFTGVDKEIKLDSCILKSALPFHFSVLRFLSLLAVSLMVCAIVTFKLYQYDYNWESVKQNRVLTFLLIVSIGFLCSFYNPDWAPVEYKNNDFTYADSYAQMFDAFYQGRTNLKAEPPAELADLENPYDRSIRDKEGIGYYWDRAYYDGKYYSFYGATPVLLFYFPFYFISGGYVPTINMASVFFAVLAAIFIYGTVQAFVKRFIPKVNFLLLCVGLVFSIFTTAVCYLLNYSVMYTLPALSSTCFLFLCLWTGISACSRKADYKRNLLFVVCGISFVLCLESRPAKALSALILAPLFIEILIDKKESIRQRMISAFCFLIPVFLGIGVIMAYNYARFDSPFEFGASYQLTVSNVSANKITWRLFVPAMIHFFFQPMNMTNVFPYIDFSTVHFRNYGKYMYSEESAGIFTYPILMLCISVFPFLLYQMRRKKEESYVYNNARIRNYVYLLSMVITVLVAWLDFCVGGIVIRYVADVLPVISLLAIFVMLEIYRLAQKIPSLAGSVMIIFVIASVLSILISFAGLLRQGDSAIIQSYPSLISILEELICFWN